MGSADLKAKPSILLVDDEALVRKVFARMIKVADVVAVSTAEEALQQLGSQHFDAVLCDLSLPGLSGPEFYHHLVEQGRGLHNRFAVVTGGATSTEHEVFLRESKVPMVLKPTSPKVLNSLIESLVGA